MNEFQLIQEFFADWQAVGTEPILGIGDDAAVVELPENKQLVVAADTLVAGRHFPEGADAGKIAVRALRVNLSDIAAMGAIPLHYTLCLTLPSFDHDWISVFASNLREESKYFGCSLIGGDTTGGELCISLQMMGSIDKNTALRRSAAQVGDDIWVTGTLGDAAAYVASGFSSDVLAEYFWSPEPRLEFAQAAISSIRACIDVSDGLLADLGHICSASGVGAEVKAEDVPQSEALISANPHESLSLALTGGDDYELCFTAKPEHEVQLRGIAAEQNLALTRIGFIVEGEGVKCLDKTGKELFFEQRGYSHF